MKIFFNGIYGAGLSALAMMCKELGHEVLGSDIAPSSMAEKLATHGIKTYYPESADYITDDIDLVISTPAVLDEQENVVLKKARSLDIKCKRRDYIINIIAANFLSIGVAGTHGKTTTSSLLVHCLIKLDQDPSYVIGGILKTSGKNGNLGKGKYFIWEADEFANAFLGVKLKHAIINNIEYDHPDFFKTENDYFNSFKSFISNNVQDWCFINCDDKNINEITKDIDKEFIKFCSEQNAEYHFDKDSIKFENQKMTFDIYDSGSKSQVTTSLKGEANAYNITAVYAILSELGFDNDKIIEAISSFESALRRYEILLDNENVKVITDYAHHPTAIKETIKAAKLENLPITVIFEPHQYGRLKTLESEFAKSFEHADEVIILPIFASRETDIPADYINEFVDKIWNNDKKLYQSYDEAIAHIKNYSGSKRIFLCMSAGPLNDFLVKNLE